MNQDTSVMVDLAVNGNGDAVEWLVKSVQDRIHALAVKMLYHICDAEDATQEILIKIVTRLGSFRKESAFSTWALRIASNHLLNKREQLSRQQFTFKNCEDRIIRDIPDQSSLHYSEVEQNLIIEEMRVICVQGLLQCLDWEHRIVYILGEVMDITGPEGTAILGITPENFRQRLSRSRKRIRGFLTRNCELIDSRNPCKCKVQAGAAVEHGYIDPTRPAHMSNLPDRGKTKEAALKLNHMDRLSREAALMRIHPDYSTPDAFTAKIRQMIDAGRFRGLEN